MKYVQSFYNYAVTFSSIGKGVPAKNADGDLRNIAEFSDEEFEKLQNSEPLFRQLVNLKKYRVLNKLPESYKPAALLVNEARAENEVLKAKIAELEAQITTEPTEKAEEAPKEKTTEAPSKKSKGSSK